MNLERVLIARVDLLWLTVWAKNKRALEFYKVNGYHSTGILHYELQGKVHENKILAKVLKPVKSVSDVPTEPWE